MKRAFLTCAICLGFFSSMVAEKVKNHAYVLSGVTHETTTNNSAEAVNCWIDSLYEKLNLDASGLSRSVFFTACKGYEYLLSQNALFKPGILTICDYSQRSSKKRLYVLDLNECRVVFNTYVAHGRNSGNDYATSFSNSDESHKTSLGFMVTAETYTGGNGYSMRLDGMEKGFNDKVRVRTIVMHGSDYVNNNRAADGILMGRSYGCPAVPASEVTKIINCIKGGSCFFSYYPDKNYTAHSKIINADFAWPIAQTIQLAAVKFPDSIKELTIPGIPVN